MLIITQQKQLCCLFLRDDFMVYELYLNKGIILSQLAYNWQVEVSTKQSAYIRTSPSYL